ncbi:cytochrome c oxidase subunit I [Paraburkholderia caballeronis]|uniref:cytochrome-c oxidase n=1 Tax=Paraburkholderia caballeronis TaxID=416943 RepID=A0A1H7MUU4_9BURK|nr:cytochrome c oxidase subunit I [Paraburkholderia caballeronis]PXW26414.1 cytochrome c oxidase subunit 1/cytochrome c oxidase subunit I+III [Paraburkholderia caballeronis]PXX01961.1 cytochrome c oxidase subunit 1/cytochrome c oxidase subunit I+III [Paraburkholderia caballeronis]RAK01118.1 cytochrome c oxidase subunit 1/cytochrome c oxidase subunit I+III [Paraburkholderia caballeronis]SEB96988.1 cytochrome c oxidase subunit 1/cytochrome c oxidase subunit I+III [Paraburkholderia caballeronis]S
MADHAELKPSRVFDGPDVGDEARAALERTWRDPPGFVGALSAINHKTIARRFIATTFAFFLAAGLLALAMRTQLAVPGNRFVGADFYNRLFTMHGTTMMFLFAVPVMQAVAGYLVPLMIGARSVAFPRMNAYAYWVFLFGGLTLYIGFACGAAPASGWFSYVPLAGPDYATGKGSDIWAQMITFTELSALLEAIVLITTILKMRAPGMSLNRLPLFVWATLVTQFMVLFAMPAIMLASTALILDRLVGTQFYNPALGGDVLLWQHLFWFFGHPEVYLIFIPALGFLSAIIPTFARRSIVGYPAMVLALVATAFLAFGLWVHHMFATSVPALGKSFFTAASVMIAIPSGIQIFCWVATLATGRLNLKTPLLFVLAFFVILVLGGLTGVMLGSASLDLQLHDTYFVVAHLHYVLLGGAVFPLFGAFFYWFPKMTGRLLDETLGRWQFWLFFVGFNVTFFPMHLLGLEGMPRRVWTYPAGMGWSGMNLAATIGAWTIGASVLLFIVNVWRAWRRGAPATADPWGGGTLEWSVGAPPPAHNFDVLPVVRGRDPRWETTGPDARIDSVSGLAADAREVLLTTALDARPDLRMLFPSPSLWPLIAALATTLLFIDSIFTPSAVIWGSVPVAIALIAWFWPRRDDHATAVSLELPPWDARVCEGGEVRRTCASRATIDVRALPSFGFGARSPMWWATLGLMLIEGTVFAIAVVMYFYLRSANATWPLNAPPPDWRWGTLNTFVLLASLLPNEAARRAANRGDRAGSRFWLSVCLGFALVFLIVRAVEFTALNVSWYTNAYGSIVWLLLGLHTTHLITDTVDTAVLAVLLFTGPFEGRRFVDTSENAVYWYFVVLSWLPIYAVVYLAPRLQI